MRRALKSADAPAQSWAPPAWHVGDRGLNGLCRLRAGPYHANPCAVLRGASADQAEQTGGEGQSSEGPGHVRSSFLAVVCWMDAGVNIVIGYEATPKMRLMADGLGIDSRFLQHTARLWEGRRRLSSSRQSQEGEGSMVPGHVQGMSRVPPEHPEGGGNFGPRTSNLERPGDATPKPR
jgi:hypothetical protein